MAAKVRLGDIIEAKFQRSLALLMGKELDISASFKLAVTLKQIKEYKAQWTDNRLKLLTKFTEKDATGKMNVTEDGSEFCFTPDNRKKFDKEYAKLINIEVDLATVTVDDLSSVKLSPDTISDLMDKVIV